MANWADMGYAMRRRSGKTNHLESAGKGMARNIDTPEEVLASAAHAASPRRYVGMAYDGVVGDVSSNPAKGKLMPKRNTQAGDPTAGGKANRKNVPAGSAVQTERMGARYVVGAKFPAVHSIEASATLANAKIVPSVSGKQSPDFNYGIQDSRA